MKIMKHSRRMEKLGALIINVMIVILILPIAPFLPIFLKVLDFKD